MQFAHATVVYAPHPDVLFPPLAGRLNAEVPDDARLLDIAEQVRVEATGLFADIVRDWRQREATASRHQFKPLKVGDLRVVVDGNEPVLRALVQTAFRNMGIRVWKS